MVPRFDPCGREPDSCAGEGCEEDAAGGAVSTVTDFGVASVPAEAGGAGWTRQSDCGGSDLRPGASSVLPHFYEELSPPRGQQMLSHQGSPRFTGGRKSGRHPCFQVLRRCCHFCEESSPPHGRQKQQGVPASLATEAAGCRTRVARYVRTGALSVRPFLRGIVATTRAAEVLGRCCHSCEGFFFREGWSPLLGQQRLSHQGGSVRADMWQRVAVFLPV
jgi:hypothetical protein